MDLDLAGRVAFVAGSSRGIGRAIAGAFLAEGARVVVTGRHADALSRTVRAFEEEHGEDNLLACPGDLSESGGISRALDATAQRWGKLDCLVANIGSGTAKPGWRLDQEDWDTGFDVNFQASVDLVQAALPAMVQARRGAVTFVSSIVGLEAVNAPLTYSAAKAALVNYSKNLSRQVGPDGVRVNCVAPGNILFPGGSWERKMAERGEFFTQYVKAEVPLQRFGTPEEVADLVVFLSSDRASFITGACIVADGGQTRGI